MASSDGRFAPRSFAPELPPAKLAELHDKVEALWRENQARDAPTAPFEANRDDMGLRFDEYVSLLDSWRRFLSGQGISSKHHPRARHSEEGGAVADGEARGGDDVETRPEARKGADHDTWQAYHAHINRFRHFLVDIEDVTLHFVREQPDYDEARRSGRQVIPLLMLHGWPGSFLEFLDVIQPLAHPGGGAATSFAPAFDVVVPSHVGYAFSSSPKTRTGWDGRSRSGHAGPDGDFLVADEARLCHKLMQGLGFRSYAVQAGDWGSAVARSMAKQFPAQVQALHLNFCPSPPPPLRPPLLSLVPSPVSRAAAALAPRGVRWAWEKLLDLPRSVDWDVYLSPAWHAEARQPLLTSLAFHLGRALLGIPPRLATAERAAVRRTVEFQRSGSAYAFFHATRPSTLGLALESSPGALLAWVAEKFLAWSEQRPSDASILASLTLWWCTDTAPRSLYPYRNRPRAGLLALAARRENYVVQPTAYSAFPREIMPAPRGWVEANVNLRWYREHERGGHFAAMERPVDFVDDLRDCFAEIWP